MERTNERFDFDDAHEKVNFGQYVSGKNVTLAHLLKQLIDIRLLPKSPRK